MEVKKQRHFVLPKWSKWLIGIVGVIFFTILIGSWYLSYNYRSIIVQKLSDKVKTASEGLYDVAIGDVSINLLTGSAAVSNLRLTADTGTYTRQVSQHTAKSNRYDFYIHRMEIADLNFWKLLAAKEIRLRSIGIDSLKLKVIKTALPYEEKEGDKEVHERLGSIKGIWIGKVDLKDADVEFLETEKGDTARMEHVALSVSDFMLHKESSQEFGRTLYSKRIVLEIPGFEGAIPGSIYTLAFDKLKLDSEQGDIDVHGMQIKPARDEEKYFRQDKLNKALVFLNWDMIRAEGIDFNSFFTSDLLYAKKLYLYDGATVFKKNKHYQEERVSKIGEGPHQKIMKLQQRLCIDSVTVKNVLVEYRQVNKAGTDEGIISFRDTHGVLTNVTNDTAKLEEDRYMRADLRAALLGQGELHANFGFDMLSKYGEYSYKGSLSPMSAPAFNKILTPLVNLEIASGKIRRIDFDLKGNDLRNWGKFEFRYDGFKVNLLKRSNDQRRNKKGVLSFFINSFVLNDSNPDANEVYHVGHVDRKRVPEHPHFKAIWKSLEDGIIQCTGIQSDWLRKML
ncbi:hypothetical protein [Sphingobacterium paucimobilis]|uniref:AsmA-like C-terminal domain-containing protein n=1 Tax=Sphingobacterium paucimobilis HER1398 TaxID=1346330 RepID=U2J512_9SPHI|nr:hypothetical protein [Sphingobacterium paucimobilis]ERJ57753.1 hypothetical protein M472_03135 [Sphingobacterium paucimobilis HER1398]